MSAIALAIFCLLPQDHPVSFPGGPFDPWGPAGFLTTLTVRHEFDGPFVGQGRVNKTSKISVVSVEPDKVKVMTESDKMKSIREYGRDVPGSFWITKDRVIDAKTSTEEVTVAGKKFSCKVTTVRIKVGGESKEEDLLKVWQTDQIPGGVAKFERVRHAFNLERDPGDKTVAEITELDQTLTIAGKKVKCAIMTATENDTFNLTTVIKAWHSDEVPGKVAKITTERKLKDRTDTAEWTVTEFARSILDPKKK